MSVELTTKFAPQTDDLFKAESKVGLLTNTDYDWTGAHAIKLYKISTTPLNDYSRNRSTAPEDTSESLSRYGKLLDLSATTEELLLKHDRSFIFNVDRLDQDETQQQLEAGTALARELREVVIPEVDTNVYTVMTTGAGHKPAAAALTKSNIYAAILAASQALDDAEVPETERSLVVTPATYALLKQAGFMLAHPSATVAPVKLEDFGIHDDTPLSSGTIVTGRVCYDAFVLDNKKVGIYYQETT